MTRPEELDAVVRLACLVEDRTDVEQRALLSVARRADDDLNERHYRAWRAPEGRPSPPRTPYPSELERLVATTRVLDEEDGQRPVRLKARKRRPWVEL